MIPQPPKTRTKWTMRRVDRWSLVRSSKVILLGVATLNLLVGSCANSVDSRPRSEVELDTSRLTTNGRLTVHFDPPIITGSVFFLRVHGGPLYWLGPAVGNVEAKFGVVDSNEIVTTLEAVIRESAELILPDLPDYKVAEICFNEDFNFCVPLNESQLDETADSELPP